MNSRKTTVILGDPGPPRMAMLEPFRESANFVMGKSPDEFGEEIAGAEIIFNWSGGLEALRETFLRCPAVKWVHTRSAGLEKSLFAELIESRAILTNGTGVFSAALGEFALAAILYFAKDFRRMIRNQVAGEWKPFDVIPIEGQTLGIVGYGDIGRAIASRARAMGMRILALKRKPTIDRQTDPIAERIYRRDQLIEMLSMCDYVAVAAPLTSETRGMIGKAELAALKPSAVVINVGRGPIIEEKPLIEALSSGRIKGAALDVFDEEPLPAGHPFYKLENVLLSPHCADNTPDWLKDAMQFFISQWNRYVKQEPLSNIVDKKLGY
jgi:phosphoglycerate dehydrogenase-like enzyme